jgi:hypothetical protein
MKSARGMEPWSPLPRVRTLTEPLLDAYGAVEGMAMNA